MSVRMRITSSKTRSRRSHHKTDGPTLTVESGVVRRRHFANPETGEYRGKQVLFKAAPTSSATKKEVKKDIKEADAPRVLEAPAEKTEEKNQEVKAEKEEVKS